MANKNSEKFESVVVSSTAIGITPPATGSTLLLITCETNDVRWRDDGTNPAAGAGGGHLLRVGQALEYDGDENRIKFIREGAADGRINVSYYAG